MYVVMYNSTMTHDCSNYRVGAVTMGWGKTLRYSGDLWLVGFKIDLMYWCHHTMELWLLPFSFPYGLEWRNKLDIRKSCLEMFFLPAISYGILLGLPATMVLKKTRIFTSQGNKSNAFTSMYLLKHQDLKKREQCW